jgi:hypothetical protein
VKSEVSIQYYIRKKPREHGGEREYEREKERKGETTHKDFLDLL